MPRTAHPLHALGTTVSNQVCEAQLPASLKLEPIKFASGMVEMSAGSSLPDTNVVVINGHHRKINNGQVGGKKGTFTVVQRLWRLDPASGVHNPRSACMHDCVMHACMTVHNCQC